MPYKDKETQAEYMRKYRTPYMRKYNKRQKEHIKYLENEVQRLTKCLQVALNK